MAGLSEVQICNMALSHIGARSRIESFDEKSTEAKECKLWYDECRKEALEAYNWNFARKRKTLSLHADAAPENEWIFRYQIPTDNAKLRYLINPLGHDADAVPYELSTSDAGTSTSLLTNLEAAVAVYTYDCQNTALFSRSFVNALSRLVAFRIAYGLTGKKDVRDSQAQFYNDALSIAAWTDANEQVDRKPREAEHIRYRR